jgi:chromosome segregation ATPase
MPLAGPPCAPYGGRMASESQIELRVSRLENDRDSIYDILAEVRSTQQEHTRRFEVIDQRFDTIDQRFDTIDQRFDTIDQRFDTIDQRFEVIDQRFDTIQATLTEVVRRIPSPS